MKTHTTACNSVTSNEINTCSIPLRRYDRSDYSIGLFITLNTFAGNPALTFYELGAGVGWWER